ncbi:putative membrane protein [Clostridiales Family XIII bacterium PM5-7]
MKRDEKMNKIVLTGLMMCLVTVATMFIKVPVPFTQGYVHLGDSMIFLAVLILGKRDGVIAAGVGSALGDILGGYAFWAPWTLIIKGVMALIMAIFLDGMRKKGKLGEKHAGVSFIEVVGMTLAGAFMVAGYYVTEVIMYGNWMVPIPSIPFNIGQFVVGMVLAVLMETALCKTSAKKYFARS